MYLIILDCNHWSPEILHWAFGTTVEKVFLGTVVKHRGTFDCDNLWQSCSPSSQVKRKEDSKSGDGSNVSVGALHLFFVCSCKLGSLLVFLWVNRKCGIVSWRQMTEQQYNRGVLPNIYLVITTCHHLMFRVRRGLSRTDEYVVPRPWADRGNHQYPWAWSSWGIPVSSEMSIWLHITGVQAILRSKITISFYDTIPSSSSEASVWNIWILSPESNLIWTTDAEFFHVSLPDI